MRVTFDRAEYIRARASALRKPAPAKVPRVRVKIYRTDRCSCGRIPSGARGKCEGCKAWARGGLTGGSRLTLQDARDERKHVLVVDPNGPRADDTRRWLDAYPIETLNVAGPRESKQPGIYAASYAFLMRVMGGVK